MHRTITLPYFAYVIPTIVPRKSCTVRCANLPAISSKFSTAVCTFYYYVSLSANYSFYTLTIFLHRVRIRDNLWPRLTNDFVKVTGTNKVLTTAKETLWYSLHNIRLLRKLRVKKEFIFFLMGSIEKNYNSRNHGF